MSKHGSQLRAPVRGRGRDFWTRFGCNSRWKSRKEVGRVGVDGPCSRDGPTSATSFPTAWQQTKTASRGMGERAPGRGKKEKKNIILQLGEAAAWHFSASSSQTIDVAIHFRQSLFKHRPTMLTCLSLAASDLCVFKPGDHTMKRYWTSMGRSFCAR